jgi:hypothetical protein
MTVTLVDVVTGEDGDRFEVYEVGEDDVVKAHAFVLDRHRLRRGTRESVAGARKLAHALAEGKADA